MTRLPRVAAGALTLALFLVLYSATHADLDALVDGATTYGDPND